MAHAADGDERLTAIGLKPNLSEAGCALFQQDASALQVVLIVRQQALVISCPRLQLSAHCCLSDRQALLEASMRGRQITLGDVDFRQRPEYADIDSARAFSPDPQGLFK